MTVKVSWRRALGWRMRQQFLDPVGNESVAGVVRRLCAVQAQVASFAELAIRVRRRSSRRGEVGKALSDGRLIKTWAMRGALHLLTPEEGGAFLSLIAAGRSWERPSWDRYFGMTAKRWATFREVVDEELADGPRTREELASVVVRKRGLDRLAAEMSSGWGTVLKPLAWQGELCFGPSRGTRVTFTRPRDASARWRELPDPDEAAHIVIRSYLRAYGPATVDNFSNWLSRGRIGARQVRAWFEALKDRVAEVDVHGERAYVRAEDLDGLVATRPSSAVRLLPGFDQYVLGVGTEDHHVVATRRRWSVSKQAGWIAPVVVSGGVVSGTWEIKADVARVAWFREAGKVPQSALRAEVARYADLIHRDLRLAVIAV